MNNREAIEAIITTAVNTGLVAHHGELMLLAWAKSTSQDGPKVRFALAEDKELIAFERATIKKGKRAGQRYIAVFFEILDDEMPVPLSNNQLTVDEVEQIKKPPSLAQELHRTGYFRNSKLWDAIESKGLYTQLEHKKWIESRPCDMADQPCSGDVVGHHVRTSDNSGVGIKPSDWFLVSLCHHHHDYVHSKVTRELRGKLWILAVSLTAERMKDAVKRHLHIDSLSTITDDMLSSLERFLYDQ